MLLPFTDSLVRTDKFDAECAALADRHYSRQTHGSPQFAPPVETIILRNSEGSVLFAWCRQQYRADGLVGVANCTIFRNETPQRSSDLILEAEKWAVKEWGDIRAVTYIDPAKIHTLKRRGKPIPGFCFIKAGWRGCGVAANSKLLFEKYLTL